MFWTSGGSPWQSVGNSDNGWDLQTLQWCVERWAVGMGSRQRVKLILDKDQE